MSGDFVSWFKYGFIINMSWLVLAISQFCWATPIWCVYFIPLKFFHCCLTSFGTLIWLVMGLYFRFREVGNICSGDYYLASIELDPTVGDIGESPFAWKSGKFMKIYLLTICTIWTLSTCLCCIIYFSGGFDG